MDSIRVRGARTHNLKNLSLELPRGVVHFPPARLLAAGYRHPFGMAGVRKRAIAALGVGQPERTAHSHVSS